MKKFPTELKKAKYDIIDAAKSYGLDFYPIIFEKVSWDEMSAIAAYNGYTSRWHHWQHGMNYDRLFKESYYGVSKIYEMVINNDPCYAYLLNSNSFVIDQLVMAHVIGHCDFFKNNVYFKYTNRQMLNEMANHAARFQRYIDIVGKETVEEFVDIVLSLHDLIDPFFYVFSQKVKLPDPRHIGKIEVPEYMDKFVNPPSYQERKRSKLRKERQKKKKIPSEPMRDVLLFLIQYAPLKRWQSDILSMIREESYFFLPITQTKIMNEGWACIVPGSLVHTEKGFVPIEFAVEWCDKVVGYHGKLTDITRRCVTARVPTVKIRTNRGLYLEAATHHRIVIECGDGNTRDEYMDFLKVGDKLVTACGTDIWPEEKIKLDRVSYFLHSINKEIKLPLDLNEDLAYVMGAFLAIGNQEMGCLNFTTNDAEYLDCISRKLDNLFSLDTKPFLASITPNIYKICINFKYILTLFHHLGIFDDGIPWSILQSPKPIVSSFIAGYFDGAGDIVRKQLVFTTDSYQFINHLAILLLNYGIIGFYNNNDKEHQLQIRGAKYLDLFYNEIPLTRKKFFLEQIVKDKKFGAVDLEEKWSAEIISIEYGHSINYDWEIPDGNHYVAQGFLNHNTYWHEKIMTGSDRFNEYRDILFRDKEAPLPIVNCADIVDFSEVHSGISRRGSGLNPYWLGLQIWRDIEDRWNKGKFGKEWEECEDLVAKENWDKHLGLGRNKIFEVRTFYNDVNFIHEFLTPELFVKLSLFEYAYEDKLKAWYVASRKFKDVKRKLIFNLTNYGKPVIRVIDGNFQNKGILLLQQDKNEYNFILDKDKAIDVLIRIQKLWTRPVYLRTWDKKEDEIGIYIDSNGRVINEKLEEDCQVKPDEDLFDLLTENEEV